MCEMPSKSFYKHVGNAAMFTRNGQLSLAKNHKLRWWQASKSTYPMYKLTAYFCAIEKWVLIHHGMTASKIGLWPWPLDATISAHFKSNPGLNMIRKSGSSPRDVFSPRLSAAAEIPDGIFSSTVDTADDVVAYKRLT